MDPIRPVSIISEEDVIKYLPMSTCVSLMRELFAQVAAGKANQPLRTFVPYVLGSTNFTTVCVFYILFYIRLNIF